MIDLEVYKKCIKQCRVGKRLPDAIYLHRSTLSGGVIPVGMIFWTQTAKKLAGNPEWDLVKFDRHKQAISFLQYPLFDEDAHPALHSSTRVDLVTEKVTRRQYKKNRPSLHRKELFVLEDYPLYQEFIALTKKEEKIGLLKDCSKVGFKKQWDERCSDRGIFFQGNQMEMTLEQLKQKAVLAGEGPECVAYAKALILATPEIDSSNLSGLKARMGSLVMLEGTEAPEGPARWKTIRSRGLWLKRDGNSTWIARSWQGAYDQMLEMGFFPHKEVSSPVTLI